MSSDPSEPLVPADNPILSIEHDDSDIQDIDDRAEFGLGYVI
jgi:hypothetical protein